MPDATSLPHQFQKNKQCLQLIKRFVPTPAVTGLAVNDVPLPGLLNNGNAVASPVAFCRPGVNSDYPSGVHPEKTAASGAVQYNPAVHVNYVNSTGVLNDDCVLSGQSWKVTKGDNVDITDPDWYSVDYEFPTETPKAVYFVRVFVKDVHGNYLGFGSSATSANLTNNNVQNFFKVDRWDALKSSAVASGPGSGIHDIQAGAIGCSLATVLFGALFFAYDGYKSRQEDRRATTVVEDTAPAAPAESEVVKNPLAVTAQ